ncbi:MAG: PLP-dependent aspartate aminotransferase family protein [Clostridia bacterium]|nr:PLP-dependent aspartate aminotransferase family protein [Clostridia bacterium]
MQFSTKCIHGDGQRFAGDNTGAVSVPIYQTATYAHPEAGKSTGYDYSRLQNPTREQLEKVVACLEGGVDALAFSSGMAAIAALMELFSPGDNIICDCDLYGGTVRLFDNITSKNGVTVTRADCSSQDIAGLIAKNTRAVYIETPTNPMMNVIDIAALAKITRQKGILLIVDNTFLSPYFQNPLSLGADVVVHSGTKFLGGHNDALAGFLVVNSNELSEKLRFIIKTVGSGLAPFDSWLVLRGIKTLPVRMEKSQQNAIAIAKYLQSESKVTKVYYCGIEGGKGYEITKRQARGFGSMITFEVESRALALHILKSVKLIRFAESLGGVETLITYPFTQTHADVPEDLRIKNGITDRVLRLSAGIEDAADLIFDLKQAIDSTPSL